MLLKSGAIAQASNTSLKAPLSDLTDLLAPHIFKGGRREKFSETPEIKYFLFPFMYMIIRGGWGKGFGTGFELQQTYTVWQTCWQHVV